MVELTDDVKDDVMRESEVNKSPPLIGPERRKKENGGKGIETMAVKDREGDFDALRQKLTR